MVIPLLSKSRQGFFIHQIIQQRLFIRYTYGDHNIIAEFDIGYCDILDVQYVNHILLVNTDKKMFR